MTQHELVIEYIKEFGKIIPAKMGGKIYKDVMFGSETGKRCRELRKGWKKRDGTYYPILNSEDEGRFEVYFFESKKPASLIETFEERKVQPLFEFEPIKKFRNPYEA